MSRLLLVCMAAGVLLGFAGCCPPPIHPPPRNYTGPTSNIYQVIERINANNRPITSIFAYHHFAAWIHDEKGKVHNIDGDGQLMFRKTATKPNELWLTGENVGIGKVFELGSASGPDAEFWVAVVPKEEKEWWGHYKNLGKPCLTEQPPIRPDLVSEVLGVGEIPNDLLQPPMPVMRFVNEEDAYVFSWLIPLADRLVLQKEVWYDRATYLPMRVMLYDQRGRAVLRADLAGYLPVEGAGGAKLAREYQMMFPDTQDILTITLYSPRLSSKHGLPKAGTIQRRPINDQVQQIQIDENCP